MKLVQTKNFFPRLHVELSNLGPVFEAEFDVKNITMICGGNNVGKTYTTYALYGFLCFFRSFEYSNVLADDVKKIIANGNYAISALDIINKLKALLNEASKEYCEPRILASVFGANDSFFRGAKFNLSIPNLNYETLLGVIANREGEQLLDPNRVLRWTVLDDSIRFAIIQKEGHKEPVNRLLHRGPLSYRVSMAVNSFLIKYILGSCLPTVHILCAERTGAVIFQKELDFNRNSLLEVLRGGDMKASPIYRFFQEYSSHYPLPIKANVNTARDIPEGSRSFLVEGKESRCRKVLDTFADIIGGDYKIVRGRMKFLPREELQKRLDMVLSSSSIRALMHMAVYLYYQAQVGDILIIDEPEQNLNPVNQRKIARLFALLSTLGVRIFLTTHSDYIVREINNIVMLNHANEVLKARLCARYNYRTEELVDAKDVEVCWAQLKTRQQRNKTKRVVIIEAQKVSPNSGVDAKFFNDTIDEMNEIQSELAFG